MRLPHAPALFVILCLAVGCKSRVVFTTQTSLGLDVSGTAQWPNKVSFSYNRFEGAIVPRKTNGEAHSVYGGMDADINFFSGHTIKQTFATGKAAMLVSGADTNGVDFPGTESGGKDHPLVFLTATTFGLHLTAGEKEMSPNLLLGYRRSEAAVIPVPEPAQEVRSVYADILINSSTDTNATAITTNFSALRGVRIKQSFATGRAADALAAARRRQPPVQGARPFRHRDLGYRRGRRRFPEPDHLLLPHQGGTGGRARRRGRRGGAAVAAAHGAGGRATDRGIGCATTGASALTGGRA